MNLLSVETFVPSPAPGVGVFASSYYARRHGGELVSVHSHISRSDTADVAFIRRSGDNGRTWSAPEAWPTKFDHPEGTGRRHPRGGYVDLATGRYITVWTEGVLPTDRPLEGMRQWKLHYSVSEDGGASRTVDEQIVCDGEEFDAEHPLPDVFIGRNCVMIGDLGQRPLTRSDGAILMPVQSSPLGPEGRYHNPGGGLTWTDALLLIGRWRDDGRLGWSASRRVAGDPARTTRGMIEPTIAELADGRILMVMRGSNHKRPDLPGRRWFSMSSDGGETWTEPVPWTYTDGEPFHSPSACSQLVDLALEPGGGPLLWLGNICRDNPDGNGPRYPFVVGEVDRRTGGLIRDSVTVIDDRREGEDERLTLSNFYARADRETGDLLLHMSRAFASGYRGDGRPDWTCDAMLYRIETG